jgi:dephospho-CoA kinase
VRTFGLTGGLATGKSTVAARFRERGVSVLDADQLAREVVAKGSAGLEHIVEAFGEAVLTADGQLDRAALGRRVFDDPEALSRLNAIVHPRVAARVEQRLSELRDAGIPLACYEVPLLYENGLEEKFHPVVVVSAPPQRALERAMRRNGWTAGEVERRRAAQWPLEDKVARADYTIDNSGSLLDTLEQADSVLERIRRASSRLSPGKGGGLGQPR